MIVHRKANRLQREWPDDRARFRASLLPSAGAGETDLGLAFLAEPSDGEANSRWPSYAQVLLFAHEFRQIQ